MDKSSASSYIYAKSSGMLAKTFVGQKSLPLFEAKSLGELWELIFKTPVPALPEVILANKIETESVKRFVRDYTKLLELYSNPDSFLIELIRLYDVENLKVISASLSMKETSEPRIVDIGDYRTLNYKAWPNISKITESSPFSWYDHVPTLEEKQHLDYMLDMQEFQILWKSLHKVSDSSKEALIEYFRKDYAIKNMLWALRLRVYYDMSQEVILSNLFYVDEVPSMNDPLCSYAYEVLNLPIDSYEDWSKWRFSSCLNPHEEGAVWKVDPVWIEQKLRIQEVASCKRLFHQYPMTNMTMCMFYRMKQQELNCIRAATEAIRLNVDKSEAMSVAGVTSKE